MALFLAFQVGDLNRLDLHLEEQFDGSLDFRLGGVRRNDKDHLFVLVGDVGGLLGDLRRNEDLHQTFLVEGIHPSISSILATAPLVSSTFLKRTSEIGSVSFTSSTRTLGKLREDR